MTPSARAADFADAAAAGALAKLATVPLDCILTPMTARRDVANLGTLETARRIFRSEGLRGFWKGAVVDVWRGGVARGLTIGLFEAYQHSLGLTDGPTGVLTGATVVVLTYPIEVLQTWRRGSIAGGFDSQKCAWSALRVEATLKGIRGIYPALVPTLVGTAGFWGVQFGCRQPLVDFTGSLFAAGFLGSSAALLAVNWNNCVRLTMQRRALEGLPQRSWRETLRFEYRCGGVRRFYVGFPARIAQTGLSMGVLFSAYDYLRKLRDDEHRN
eukprot:TRINITY_DN43025_c0_g1_i1.p1 TRINITY_DN43025_c0_g1~~TRINITY_DN43025_c0_g1_i1.p1  ORF type:complete len:271 (-),score=35.26 TRINITY_DN43025_c0_g1_i1:45-857(-)